MMLDGVAGPEFFDAVSGTRGDSAGACTFTGEVLLGAGNGAFVSNGLAEIFTSATFNS
jgi:hypothetical protein